MKKNDYLRIVIRKQKYNNKKQRIMNRQKVLGLATKSNPIINDTENKIEFQDGTIYSYNRRTGEYNKVKAYVL